MYAFSPLSLFKSKSKAFAKKNGIKLSDTREQLAQSAGFSNYHSIQTIDANPNIVDRLFNCTLGVEGLYDIPYEPHLYQALANAVVHNVLEKMSVPDSLDLSIKNLRDVCVEYSCKTGVALVSSRVDVTDIDEAKLALGDGYCLYTVDVDYEVKFRNEIWTFVPCSVDIKKIHNPPLTDY